MGSPRLKRRLLGLAVAILVVALPLITTDQYYIQVAGSIGIAVILALGLGLLYGHTGQMSFAHAGFYGIGAYASVLMTTRWQLGFGPALLAALLVPGVVAFVIGIPTLRLRGHYLAIATLALQLTMVEFFVRADGITGGTVGVFGIERPTVMGLPLEDNGAYYQVIAVAAILTFVFAQRLARSRFGRGLVATREDEVAASVIGINPARYKLLIFTISAMLAGLAGALYAHQILFISPVTFNLDWSIAILSMVVIGGVGSNYGAVAGAVVVTLIQQVLFSLGDLQFLMYGAWIVLVMLFFPGGLVGIARSLAARWRDRRDGAARAPAPDEELEATGV